MYRLLQKLNERGYTLIESLFQLMIFAVFIQLLLLFFLWKVPIEQNYINPSNVEWELFAVDLQQELENIYEFQIAMGNRSIRYLNDRGRIDIDYSNGVVRKRVLGQGHIPFLANVHSIYFTQSGTALLVEVRLLDGTRKERDFTIGLYPK